MIQSMPHPIRGSSRLRALFLAALVPFALSACAPDAWKNNPNYDAFVNQILRNCGNKNMGELTVADLMNQDNSTFSAYFYDLTARWVRTGSPPRTMSRVSCPSAAVGSRPASSASWRRRANRRADREGGP